MTDPREAVIDGLTFDVITSAQLVTAIVQRMHQGEGGVVATINTDHVLQYRIDPVFRAATESATYRVADGMPLVWLSKLLKTPLPERVTGSDLITKVCAALAPHQHSIAIIGGPEGVGQRTAESLAADYPGLQIAMVQAPPIGFYDNEEILQSLRDELRLTRPDFVFLALGMPRQEILISDLRQVLPDTWWMGVGAGIEFLDGSISRAPVAMQRAGLEWLYRLLQEPRRLGHRYLVRDLPYLAGATSRAVKQRFASSDRSDQ